MPISRDGGVTNADPDAALPATGSYCTVTESPFELVNWPFTPPGSTTIHWQCTVSPVGAGTSWIGGRRTRQPFPDAMNAPPSCSIGDGPYTGWAFEVFDDLEVVGRGTERRVDRPGGRVISA